MNLEKRFWIKVKKTDSCWLWMAGKFHFGHGRFKIRNKNKQAHRVSWEMKNGPIPNGMLVCHKCDVPSCVNPDHLFLGTYKDNMQDSLLKGRNYEANRTHCPKGHPYSIENTQIYNNKRKCKTCSKQRHKVFD